MIDIKDLTTELATLDEQLTTLRARRSTVVSELHQATKNNIEEEFNSWNLKADDCLLLFAKDSFDFSLIKTIFIKKIDNARMSVSFLEGNYTAEYDECNFRVSSEISPYSRLLDYKKNYNIYVTDPTMLNVLHSHLCSLLVNSSNLKEYEKSFDNSSERAI